MYVSWKGSDSVGPGGGGGGGLPYKSDGVIIGNFDWRTPVTVFAPGGGIPI